MTSVREAIHEQNRLSRMRAGQLAPEYVDVPSKQGIRLALVPLTEHESRQGLLASAALDLPDNVSGFQIRNRVTLVTDVWHACREMDDPSEKVWRTPEEMEKEVDPADIDYLGMRLAMLMDYASPSLATLSDETIETLKKVSPTIPWRELTGMQAAAARVFLSTVLAQALPDNWSGFISTDSLTIKTENPESTFDAFPSTETISEPVKSVESQ